MGLGGAGGGVKNFSAGICDGAPSTARSSLFIYLFEIKLLEVLEYTKIQFHMMTLLDILGKIAWVR